MRQKNSKRLDALERAADKEVFADAFDFAVAYYIGGARHMSEVVDAYARALSYKDLHELCQALADLLREPSDSVAIRRIFERICRVRCQLLAKFGYDLRRAQPAALADAAYRIVRTLPEEWLTTIRSAHRKSCEAEARANQLLKEVMKLVSRGVLACSPYQTAPRRSTGRRSTGSRRAVEHVLLL